MNKSKRIVILLSRVPYPLEKGDKLRAFYQIKELSNHYDIYLCALDSHNANLNDASEKLNEFCKQILFIRLTWAHKLVGLFQSFFSRTPFQIGLFYNFFTQRTVNKWISTVNPDAVYVQLHRMAPYLKTNGYPNVLDFQDAFSMGVYRQIPKISMGLRPIFKLEYALLKRYEQQLLKQFKFCSIISEIDDNWINPEHKYAIKLVRNGVDFDFYQPIASKKDIDILFTGNMGYMPNIDAAEFLIKQIMPLVWAKFPQIKVVLAGSNPHSKVLALQSKNTTITGFVDDLRPYYHRSKIFIAPLRIGSGLQNKLLEAMAMGIPCITSNIANNSLKATDNQDVIISNTAEEFAESIFKLIENQHLSNQISNNALQFVSQFDWKIQTEKLHLLIEESIISFKNKNL